MVICSELNINASATTCNVRTNAVDDIIRNTAILVVASVRYAETTP